MPVTDPIQQLQEISVRFLKQLAEMPTRRLFGSRSGPARQRAGQSPGTLFIDPAAAPTRIRATRFDDDGVETLAQPNIETLREARGRGGRLWVDVAGFANDQLVKQLVAEFGLHPLTVADLVNTECQIKTDSYEDHHVIITQMPHLQPEVGQPEIEPLGLVLGEDWLLTFRARPGPLFKPLYDRIERPGGRIQSEPLDYLAYALLDLAVDSFFPVVETLADRLDGLEDAVMAGGGQDVLPEVHQQRRALITLGRLFWRQRDLAARLLRDDQVFNPHTQVYLRDVYDHAVQLLDMTETTRELAASLIEIHLSISANRSNQIMQTLTIMASIFIPLTFIAGIYGMNFERMPELAWPWGYPVAMGFMLVIALALLWWFRRRGWLGGDYKLSQEYENAPVGASSGTKIGPKAPPTAGEGDF